MPVNRNWIVNRLIPIKQKSLLFRELATVIQNVINKAVEPYLLRLKNRPSLFDMDAKDLNTVIGELGDFYSIGNTHYDKSDLPIIIMQRKDEVHQKRTIYPLINTIQREFSGKNVEWEALYAPADQNKYPYGTLFLNLEDSESYPGVDEWFLTSRGAVRAPILSALNAEKNDLGEFIESIERFIIPLLPLRIVCHGLILTERQDIKIHVASIIKIAELIEIGPKPIQPEVTSELYAIPYVTTQETVEIPLL